jgi:hypothetical protein
MSIKKLICLFNRSRYTVTRKLHVRAEWLGSSKKVALSSISVRVCVGAFFKNGCAVTGTNSTNLSWTTWARLTRIWTPKQIVEGITRAGNPTSSAILVCLPIVRVGDVAFRDQAVRAQQRSDAGVFSSINFGGILGSDILQHFEITFDLGHNTVFLEADKRYKGDPYRYVTIGIQIAKNDQDMVQVMSVWKDSPAARAGFRPGDLIKTIEGQPTETLSLEQLSSKLHAKEGTAINLSIERNGDLSTIMVHTRSLLCTHRQPRSKDRGSE